MFVPTAHGEPPVVLSAFLVVLFWKSLSLIKTAAPLQLVISPRMFADG